jgi:hypothetical protein
MHSIFIDLLAGLRALAHKIITVEGPGSNLMEVTTIEMLSRKPFLILLLEKIRKLGDSGGAGAGSGSGSGAYEIWLAGRTPTLEELHAHHPERDDPESFRVVS